MTVSHHSDTSDNEINEVDVHYVEDNDAISSTSDSPAKQIYSRLSLFRNPRDYETLRDICTSTYQFCGTEENN